MSDAGFEERRKQAAALMAPKKPPIVGVVNVGRDFTNEDLLALVSFADEKGVDIDNIRLKPVKGGFGVYNASSQDPKQMDAVVTEGLKQLFGVDPAKTQAAFKRAQNLGVLNTMKEKGMFDEDTRTLKEQWEPIRKTVQAIGGVPEGAGERRQASHERLMAGGDPFKELTNPELIRDMGTVALGMLGNGGSGNSMDDIMRAIGGHSDDAIRAGGVADLTAQVANHDPFIATEAQKTVHQGVEAPTWAQADDYYKGGAKSHTVDPEGQFVYGKANSGKKVTVDNFLDMSPEARQARAESMGFTVDGYHGTEADIKAFDPAKRGMTTGADDAKEGFFFSGKPETAEAYSDYMYHPVDKPWNSGPNIIRSKLKIQKPMVIDRQGAGYTTDWEFDYAGTIKKARREGYDSVIFTHTFDGGPEDSIYVVFEPEQIRSAYAAFDPGKAKSAMIDADALPPAKGELARFDNFDEAMKTQNNASRPGDGGIGTKLVEGDGYVAIVRDPEAWLDPNKVENDPDFFQQVFDDNAAKLSERPGDPNSTYTKNSARFSEAPRPVMPNLQDPEGRDIVAKVVAGIRDGKGVDTAISTEDLNYVVKNLAEWVNFKDMKGSLGRAISAGDPGTRPNSIMELNNVLIDHPNAFFDTMAHETGHIIDHKASWPLDKMLEAQPNYDDIIGEMVALSKKERPDYWAVSDAGFQQYLNTPAELTADSIKSYMLDPKGTKEMAPQFAKWLRSVVNEDDVVKNIVQFNSLVGAGLLGERVMFPPEGDPFEEITRKYGDGGAS